jgi:hypothetical protein
VNLEGPLPGRVADLWSIEQDLRFVADCCAKWLELQTAQVHASLVERALWEAATIPYGRCFHQGKGNLESQRPRYRIPDDVIDQLDARTTHEAVMADRNQHIAHRISDREQVKVTGYLAPDPAPRELVGVGAWGVILVSREAPDVEKLRVLAEELGAGVAAELERPQHRIMELAPDHLDDFYEDATKP